MIEPILNELCNRRFRISFGYAFEIESVMLGGRVARPPAAADCYMLIQLCYTTESIAVSTMVIRISRDTIAPHYHNSESPRGLSRLSTPISIGIRFCNTGVWVDKQWWVKSYGMLDNNWMLLCRVWEVLIVISKLLRYKAITTETAWSSPSIGE